ncbi:MAG TPA: NUDIX hydrolase, partial [Anaerolineales bacterium]|nr:NUDIX hydrolase [Anaerolineales bacterium]
VINYCGAVAVLASQKRKILLVKQFRYAINKFTLEIPAGNLVGPGRKNIILSAQNELLEESGYIAGSIEPFYSYYPSPGNSNEVIHLTRASDIEKSIDVSDFDVAWYDLDKVLKMIEDEEIVHSPTVIGVLLGREMGFFESEE